MNTTVQVGSRTFRIERRTLSFESARRMILSGINLQSPDGTAWQLLRCQKTPNILHPIPTQAGVGGVAGGIRFHLHPSTGELRCIRQPKPTTHHVTSRP